MDKTINQLKHFSKYKVWSSTIGTEEFLILSHKSNNNGPLKFLSAFHLVICFKQDCFSIQLMAFNGRVIETEEVKNESGIDSSLLVRMISEPNFEICSGIVGSSDYSVNDTLREYFGNNVVQRSKECRYICRQGYSICESCQECSIKEEIKDEIKEETDWTDVILERKKISTVKEIFDKNSIIIENKRNHELGISEIKFENSEDLVTKGIKRKFYETDSHVITNKALKTQNIIFENIKTSYNDLENRNFIEGNDEVLGTEGNTVKAFAPVKQAEPVQQQHQTAAAPVTQPDRNGNSINVAPDINRKTDSNMFIHSADVIKTLDMTNYPWKQNSKSPIKPEIVNKAWNAIKAGEYGKRIENNQELANLGKVPKRQEDSGYFLIEDLPHVKQKQEKPVSSSSYQQEGESGQALPLAGSSTDTFTRNESQRQIRITPKMYLNRINCDLCGRNFTDVTLLNAHKRDHANAEPFNEPQTLNSRPFQCEICGKEFTEETLYKNHKKRHLKCEECESEVVFRSMRELEDHKKNFHRQKPFQCHKCDKKFSSTKQLVYHSLNHCTNLKRQFRCRLCNKPFNNRRESTRHLEFNCPEKRCEHCGERYEIEFSKAPIANHRCKKRKTRKSNDRRY